MASNSIRFGFKRSVLTVALGLCFAGGAHAQATSGSIYGTVPAGATVTIKNATVNSSAQNGNGVFSYGSGTTVNISDSMITTSADNSGGIQTTGGGTTNAENLTVTTSDGQSFAFELDPFRRHCLLNGLDDIGLSLEKVSSIDSFEKKQAASQPWL